MGTVVCYLITVGLDGSEIRTLEDLAKEWEDFAVRRSRNPYVVALFPPDDLLFEVTRGGCSCDVYAGSTAAEDDAGSEDRQRERYRKKGWSSAKIERAIRASRTARLRRERRYDAPKEMLRRAVAKLAHRSGRVRLLVHWYRGLFDEEEVAATGRATLTVEEYLAAGGAFPEDVLLEVVGRVG